MADSPLPSDQETDKTAQAAVKTESQHAPADAAAADKKAEATAEDTTGAKQYDQQSHSYPPGYEYHDYYAGYGYGGYGAPPGYGAPGQCYCCGWLLNCHCLQQRHGCVNPLSHQTLCRCVLWQWMQHQCGGNACYPCYPFPAAAWLYPQGYISWLFLTGLPTAFGGQSCRP